MAKLIAVVATLLVATACGTQAEGPSDTPEPVRAQVTIYLTSGERLEAVTRELDDSENLEAGAVGALLRGPTAEESAAGIGTAIPEGTRFRDLTLDGRTAVVDLSRQFESGGGTLSMTIRLAQLVCTLDEFDSVHDVLLALDGERVDVFSGEGLMVDRPQMCADFAEYLPEGAAPEAQARATVEAFLAARVAGSGAEDYLTTNAMQSYDGADLDLYAGYTGYEIVALEAADASSFEVSIALSTSTTSFGETLFVGPGTDLEGRQRPFVVRGAVRT